MFFGNVIRAQPKIFQFKAGFQRSRHQKSGLKVEHHCINFGQVITISYKVSNRHDSRQRTLQFWICCSFFWFKSGRHNSISNRLTRAEVVDEVVSKRALQTSENVHFLLADNERFQKNDPLDALGERRRRQSAVVADEIRVFGNQVFNVENVVFENVLFVEFRKSRKSVQDRRKRTFGARICFFEENSNDCTSVLVLERFADGTVFWIPVHQMSFSFN